jgi:hypothetical protein
VAALPERPDVLERELHLHEGGFDVRQLEELGRIADHP